MGGTVDGKMKTVGGFCFALCFTLACAVGLSPSSPVLGAGEEIVFVEEGKVVLAVAPEGSIWQIGEGYIEGARRGKSVACLYAGKALGKGDFRLTARLSVPRLGGAASFVMPDHHARFVFDWGRGGLRVGVQGAILGASRAKAIRETEGFLKPGVPFAFEVRREGQDLAFSLNGKEVYKARAATKELGKIGFSCGKRSIRVFDFRLRGQAGAPIEMPSLRPMTEMEIKRAAYPVKLKEPLAYGKDFVEVTTDNTLRRRYRFWGDYHKELQSYLEDARENVKRRGTPPRKMKMLAAFMKDVRVVSSTVKDANGKPLTGVSSTSDAQIERWRRVAKEWADFIFAFTRGEMEVEWHEEIIKQTIHYPIKDNRFFFWPKSVGDQLNNLLADKYKDNLIDISIFWPGRAVASDGKSRFKGGPGGVAWTKWPFLGGRTITLGPCSLGFIAHEMIHQIFDMNAPRSEGILLNPFHGSGFLGYDRRDLAWKQGLLCTYRNYYYYLYRRDMWRRWSIRKVHNTPKEPFSGKACAWADVEHDCWFRLPRLGNAELAKLTGITSLEIQAPKRKPYTLFKVAQNERAKLSSKYIDEADLKDVGLNNQIMMAKESAAVVRTATGQWLFVKVDLADVYVDMLKLSGRSDRPLPAYGYILDGQRPLIVIKAPGSLPAPANELGYFVK